MSWLMNDLKVKLVAGLLVAVVGYDGSLGGGGIDSVGLASEVTVVGFDVVDTLVGRRGGESSLIKDGLR